MLVSICTEKQQKLGESLRTQRKSNERDVGLLGGRIVGWCGEQKCTFWDESGKSHCCRLMPSKLAFESSVGVADLSGSMYFRKGTFRDVSRERTGREERA
jgi:hypothetical protein